jgi:hypothetical protein
MKAKNDQMPIPIGMSLANCHGDVDALAVYEFIVTESGNAGYSFRPRPGTIAGAALDFYLVLSAVGSVASVASILWMAYDKFIAPKKRDVRDDAGIYIAIRRPDGTVVEVWLGRDVHTKEDFTQQFELIVEEARDPHLRVVHKQTFADILTSDSWVSLGSKPTKKG